MTMTSREVASEHGQKHKRQRACDMCRRKKRRCDGGERCNRCTKRNIPCTYLEPSTIRHVAYNYDWEEFSDSYDTDYVEDLKQRLQTAELTLQRKKHSESGQPHLFAKAIRALVKPLSPPHPEDSASIDIADSFRALSIDSPFPDPGFQGKGSAAMLVKAAVAVRPRNENGESHARSHRNLSAPKPWTFKSWELTISPHNPSFPDDSMMDSLVSLYFLKVNGFIPLLHRPTFKDGVNQRLHIHDPRFATVVLLVCALGSLHLADPAISKQDREELAWKCYNQVELCGHSLRQQPTLYDIQAYCLAVQFLSCTSNPRFAWSIAGFGMRFAQDVGLHFRKTKGPTITADEELDKRAFWILALFDTQLSGALGRPAVLGPAQTDVDLPWECDDEYWQASGPGYQPFKKPSVIAFFNCLLNLYRLQHFIVRNFYTITRTNQRTGILNDLSQSAVEFDSALDKWFSCIPEHLIWHPDRPDSLFFDQSAALHCFYYYTRILVHRPFIPGLSSMMEPDPLALGLCADAARACIQVADIHGRRRSHTPLLFSPNAVFTAATMLLLNKWSTDRGLHNPTDDLALVYTSIDILKTQQERWPSSGHFIIVLERLISIDQNSTEQQLTDHEPSDPTQSSVYPSLTRESEPGPTRAAPWMGTAPYAKSDDLSEAAIAPAFVGDEEILPGKRYRPPVPSLYDGE